MQESIHAIPTELELAPLSGKRQGFRRSAVVNRALAIEPEFNTICAIEYLKANGIAAHLIERILLHPLGRRRPP